MARRSQADEGAAALVVQEARASKEAARARGEALVAQAVALRERIAKDFWKLGRLLARMRDEDVHRTLGYERADELFAERVGIAPTLAWKLIAVAAQLPREHAVKLGQEKAYALVALVRATPGNDSAAELAAADVEIAGKPLSQASLRELQAAVAAARPKRPRTLEARRRAAEETAFVKAIQARLDALGLPRRGVALEGDEVVIRITRRQARRLVG